MRSAMTRRTHGTALLLCASLLAISGFAAAAVRSRRIASRETGCWACGVTACMVRPDREGARRHADEPGLTQTRARRSARSPRGWLTTRRRRLFRALHEEMRQLLDGESPKLEDVMPRRIASVRPRPS
jgi:hypothetical protein